MITLALPVIMKGDFMLTIRYAEQRGRSHPAIHWLESYHSFSFADYYDPQHMHFSHLRVLNEDIIQAQQGFGMHPHQDMEILTYVLQGKVQHQDSMGNHTEIGAGEFQLMSAGRGVSHAEMNPSHDEPLHLYQIWIIPNQKGITPRYTQGKFADKEGACLILSPEGEAGSFPICQDMKLWRWQLTHATQTQHALPLSAQRRYWLQMVKGEMEVNGHAIKASDGIAIRHEQQLHIQLHQDCEFLLFDFV